MGPFHLLRLERTIGVATIDTLLIFVATDDMPSDKLAAAIDDEVERNLVPDEVILVVRELSRAAIAAQMRTDRQLQRTRRRLHRADSVTVVGFDADGADAGREVVLGSGRASDMSLAEVGRRGATAIFHEHGGFVEANANYHFRNPSRRHTDRFMRLSNLLVRHSEIALIAMALLPLIPSDAVAVHVDTPAMFTLVAAVNEHLRSLAPGRQALRCESFRSYLGVATHDFDGMETGVVLISATSSGSLARIVEGRKVDPARIAHVLYLGPDGSDVRAAVDLSFHRTANPGGVSEKRETYQDTDCAMCEAGSTAVDLHGDQFDLGGPDFEPLTLKKTDAPEKLQETLDRLAGTGSFGITLTSGPGGRQFLIDADRLLVADPFLRRLDYFAKNHVPASTRECIVVDPVSRAFATELCARAGISPRIVDRANVDDLDRDDEAAGIKLNGAPILIAASVIESGRSLLDVSRDLRKVRPNSPQIYVIGFAKSASLGRRQELERTLIQTQEASPHRFAAIEELVLPPSGSPNAWRAELAFLNDAVAGGARLSPELTDRRELLRRTSNALVDDLFVANGAKPLKLQPGFVFWPAGLPERASPSPTQADVHYTISAVLQRLRTTPPKAGARTLRTNWFQQTLLDPANIGRFNDGVIQASLVRAARPTEIDFSGEAGSRLDASRVISRIIAGAHRPRGEAAAEMLIALGSRRLRLPQADLPGVLSADSSHPPLVAELADLCRRRLLPA